MVTTATEPLFLDTNVLVYASLVASPLHATARGAIESHEAAAVPLVISRQILREFLATLNRPQVGIPVATLTAQVRHFESRFRIIEDSAAVTAALLTLLQQGVGRRVHDANIVATMQVGGVRRLLTNNPGDFTEFAHIIAVIPLV